MAGKVVFIVHSSFPSFSVCRTGALVALSSCCPVCNLTTALTMTTSHTHPRSCSHTYSRVLGICYSVPVVYDLDLITLRECQIALKNQCQLSLKITRGGSATSVNRQGLVSRKGPSGNPDRRVSCRERGARRQHIAGPPDIP